MIKHTPGPWLIFRAKDSRTILQIGKCTADEYAGAVWLEVTEPDACLIAAAPDLLEALELMIDELDPMKLNCGDPWCRSRAAIAKARGEQP